MGCNKWAVLTHGLLDGRTLFGLTCGNSVVLQRAAFAAPLAGMHTEIKKICVNGKGLITLHLCRVDGAAWDVGRLFH